MAHQNVNYKGFLTISGDELLKTTPIQDGSPDKYLLFEGEGELLGICSKPGIETPEENAKVSIYCRDFVEIIEINKKKLVESCQAICAEKETFGIYFKQTHYSNAVPINFKFKQQLAVSGKIKNLTFYVLAF